LILFQSDVESNVSEFEDSVSSQNFGDRISKEHIFNAFQKMRTRYHKYKGRYADLAKHYKDLELEKERVKVNNHSTPTNIKLIHLIHRY